MIAKPTANLINSFLFKKSVNQNESTLREEENLRSEGNLILEKIN